MTDIDTDQRYLKVNDNPDFTAVDANAGSCSGMHPATCTWTFNGQVNAPGYQVFDIDFVANDNKLWGQSKVPE